MLAPDGRQNVGFDQVEEGEILALTVKIDHGRLPTPAPDPGTQRPLIHVEGTRRVRDGVHRALADVDLTGLGRHKINSILAY